MVSNYLLIERYFHPICNLASRSVELMVYDLIVVDHSGTLGLICMINTAGLTTRGMEKCAAEGLTSRVLLRVLASSPFLTSLRAWSLACICIALLACLSVSTIETASLARRPSGLVHPLRIHCPTIVRLRVKELLGTILLLDRRVIVGYALLRDVTSLLHQELLVLKISGSVVCSVESRGARSFTIVESVVFHVNLNFLSFSRRSD